MCKEIKWVGTSYDEEKRKKKLKVNSDYDISGVIKNILTRQI